ncbi:glycosyltransferase family 4 protein [Pseudonocardia spirodelae]|uniref:Glycosyltransferase family 4 protein n=1 Tax=Pseudonocardia spirodelae TaxID=3133431 RepID=A0ABU8T2R9_9PSEU
MSTLHHADARDGGTRPGTVPRVHMTGSEWFATNAGGLNRYFTDLFTALRDLPGVDVTAAAHGEPPRGGSSWGPFAGGTRARVARSLAAAPGTRPRVLDRHYCLYGRPARDRHGAQSLVVHFHGPWAAESAAAGAGGLAVRAKRLAERARYAGADAYVVLSERFRDLLAADYGVPAGRIRVVPPGVDLGRFTAAAEPAGPPTVLCVRRLENRMGVDVLLDAWRAVAAARPQARLVVVGTGSAEAGLRARAAAGDLAGSVRFTGRVGDDALARLYAGAALTVVPSVALEGFGLIALESLAAGRAPVVTDCGGLPDSVRGLDPSLVVAPGDPEALAARLLTALDGDRPGPGACRAHAERFSWRAAAERHRDLYRELA